MKIETPHDLFLHELADTMSAEQIVLESMKAMKKSARDPSIKTAIEQHMDETEGQIENLKRVFESLGEKPKAVKCKGADGIAKEFESGVEDIETPEVRDAFLVGCAVKAEAYEICSYTDLVSSAELMGHTEAAKLLRQNLKQEEAFKAKLEGISEKIGELAVERAGQAGMGKRGAKA